MLSFEWDEKKRNINLKKHGIDFIDVIELFQDGNRIELETVRNGEIRYQAIGMVNNVVLLIVYTHRNSLKRIIFAGRASTNERKTYFCSQ